jgi:hypothetical protein
MIRVVLLGIGALLFVVFWVGVLNIARYAVSSGHLFSEVTLVFGGAAILEPLAIIITLAKRLGSSERLRSELICRVTKVIWGCTALSLVLLNMLVFFGAAL